MSTRKFAALAAGLTLVLSLTACGGGGAGTTWLVGSAQDVAASLRRYADLGVTHFVLSDTPYLPEIRRQGDQLLPLLRG